MIQQCVTGMHTFATNTRNVHKELKETLAKTVMLLAQYTRVKSQGSGDTVQASASKQYKKGKGNNVATQTLTVEEFSDSPLTSGVSARKDMETQSPCWWGEKRLAAAHASWTASVEEAEDSLNQKWTDVVGRKNKKNAVDAIPTPGTATNPPLAARQQRIRTRPPAIMIDIASCNDYPALAKRIKDGMDGKTIGNGITSMRKAKNGGILMEVHGDEAVVEAIRSEVVKSAGQDVSVRLLGQKTMLEIRDIDAWTDKEDIVDCIARDSNCQGEH